VARVADGSFYFSGTRAFSIGEPTALAALTSAAALWRWIKPGERAAVGAIIGKCVLVLLGSLPTLVLLDKRGEVAWTHIGALTGALVLYINALEIVHGEVHSANYDRPVSFLLFAWALCAAQLVTERPSSADAWDVYYSLDLDRLRDLFFVADDEETALAGIRHMVLDDRQRNQQQQ